ncbi:MAG: GAF domain-containing protein [Chloroflexota bacterium]|nr:GAF domain-containing protein [Chloroflexota bacterium]
MSDTSLNDLNRPPGSTGLDSVGVDAQLMFDANPISMWVFDVETLRFMAVNTAAIARYGYSRDEFLRLKIFDVRPPEDIPALQAKLDHLDDIQSGTESAGIWRHRTKEGAIFDVEVFTHPIDFNGRPARLSLNLDITDRRQAEREARAIIEDAHARLSFLLDASERLSATIRLEPMLDAVAALSLPTLGTWCLIDLAQDDGTIRRVTVAHLDPLDAPLAEIFRRHPPQGSGVGRGAGIVMRTGSAVFVTEVSEALLREVARSEDHLAALRAVSFTSLIVVPLAARGQTLGTMTLGATRRARQHTAADVALAEDLAYRISVAIDNAALYDDEQRFRRAAEQSAERTLRLQQVTAAFAEALTAERVAEVVVEHGLAALGARAGTVVLLVEHEGIAELEIASAIGYPDEVTQAWRRFPLDLQMPLCVAAKSGEPVWLEDPAELEAAFPLMAADPRIDDPALIAIPLLFEGRSVGALGLSFATARRFDPDDRAFFLALGRQCAQALERARLYSSEREARYAAEAAQRRLAFLAGASELLASTRDIEEALALLARLAIPAIADWCAVDLIEPDRTLRRLIVAHSDPESERFAHEFALRYPTDIGGENGIAQVVATGEPVLMPEVSDELLQVAARDEIHLDMLRKLGLGSLIIVPLTARGGVMGVLTLAMAESDRHFGAEDLALASDLARRVATAMDNARLYAEARLAERQIRDDAERLTVLVESSRLFAEASLDLDRLLDTIARRMCAVIGDGCVIRLITEDGTGFVPAAIHHPLESSEAAMTAALAGATATLGEGVIGRVAETGEPLLFNPAEPAQLRELLRPSLHAFFTEQGMSALLVVPMRARDRVAGTVVLWRDRGGRSYTAGDQVTLQDLADRAGLAIENAQLYHRAQEAVQARDQFLSIAAHELRTPVAGIKGYAQMLQRAQERENLTPERLRQGLGVVDRASDQLARLTSDLLDVSRIRLGQLPLRPERMDLSILVNDVAARYRELALATHQVTTRVAETDCALVGDVDRLEQVLTNLCDNALKYSPEGGEVLLTLGAAENGLLVTISDRGIGLPAGGEEAIFEPFGRAANAVVKNMPGLGLGLYICRDIVKRHGGRIWAESPGEGQGTTIHLWLPCDGMENQES